MGTENKVKIPAGVTIQREGGLIRVTGPKGTLERQMQYPSISIEPGEEEVIIATSSDRKQHIALCGTFAAHLRNMFRGVSEGYTYRMKVVYSHFPIQIKVQGVRLEISNFLGEKNPRYARLEGGVKVTLGNDEVTLVGIDREKVGTTAARIEHATRIRDRDPRVFQDGIYITERA